MFVEIVVSGKERHADMSPASDCVDGSLKPVPLQDPIFSRSENCLKDGGSGREKFRQVVIRDSEKATPMVGARQTRLEAVLLQAMHEWAAAYN
tara:strand:+ start:487 stop:765 length:279 start_codon:yes stop_codon:yes gene_type:complete